MKIKRILVTGAGAPGGPGIIRALKSASFELYTCDCNPVASGKFLTDSFIEVPKADDESFIPFVLTYSIENQIDVIFPLVTQELLKFSKEIERFEKNNIKILVSEYNSLCIANDKGKTYQHLSTQGISVPRFEIVHSLENFITAVKNLGYPQTAVCIKPVVSNGSRGVRILQEQVSEYDLLFNYKPNHLYSSLDAICRILDGKDFPELLVSAYLPGVEFTVDSLVFNGIPKLILPRSRTRINCGISIEGTFIKHESIINYCDQIIRSLHLHGPIGFQVKDNGKGEFQLLEINPRIQGTSVAALGVGVNLPAIAINQEFEEVKIDAGCIKWGTSFVRYYEEVFY